MVTAPLQRVLYISRAVDSLDAGSVQTIVTVSRDFNARNGVTGVLLYSGTHFAQLLEGPGAVLEGLMTSIRRDERHVDVRTLLSENHALRDFDRWAMAYVHEIGIGDLLESVWSARRVSVVRARRLAANVFRRLAALPGH
jgi:hypothetical protein